MSENFINPFIEFKEQIVTLSNDFPNYLNDFLDGFGIPLCNEKIELGNKKYWIDWASYRDHYSFFYDFDNCETILKGYFKSSQLLKYSNVIMDFGYQRPISKIPIDIFLNYWYELLVIAGYESVVITEDGSLFMEFIRKSNKLNSNFLIYNDERYVDENIRIS